MPLAEGEPAPWFKAATPSNPDFLFDSAAGRYVLLAFLPTEPAAAARALKALSAHQGLFDDSRLAAFGVVRDAGLGAGLKDLGALRWFLDYDAAVTAQFGFLEHPMWMLLDPELRVWKWAPIDQADAMFAFLSRLPPVDGHAGVALHAPVLIAPRIFEPELCEELVALHRADGGTFTGVMRDAGDRTLLVMDELKKRRDVLVADEPLRDRLRNRLENRLFPLLQRTVGFAATRIERYLVSCYDADDGGVFRPHRDDNTFATAHRRFACSLRLNDDFEGGDLRFPEYGSRTYRPPLGGAVVFSCSLLHEATRITRGRRYAFLPFFHDEAANAAQADYIARVRS